MKKTYLLVSCLLIALNGFAQTSLNFQVSAGPARTVDEEIDRNGFNYGFGLSLGRELGERWGTLFLELAREDFTGFHVLRTFNQSLPALDPADGETFVSLRHRVQDWRAYSVGLRIESEVIESIPRLHIGYGVSVVRQVGAQTVQYDAIEIGRNGEVIATNGIRNGYILNDGVVSRNFFEPLPKRFNNQLRRYNLAFSLIFSYKLSNAVSACLNYDRTLGPVGERYGPEGDQHMIGRVNVFRLGLRGTLF